MNLRSGLSCDSRSGRPGSRPPPRTGPGRPQRPVHALGGRRSHPRLHGAEDPDHGDHQPDGHGGGRGRRPDPGRRLARGGEEGPRRPPLHPRRAVRRQGPHARPDRAAPPPASGRALPVGRGDRHRGLGAARPDHQGGREPATNTSPGSARPRPQLADPKAFLFTWGYHQLWHGPLSRKELDAVSATRPIVVWHRSAHEFLPEHPRARRAGNHQGVAGRARSGEQPVRLGEGPLLREGARADHQAPAPQDGHARAAAGGPGDAGQVPARQRRDHDQRAGRDR